MRGPGSVVTCVRTLSREILIRREAEILPQGRRRWPRFPVLRGMSAIYESLLCGMRALLVSAGASGEDEKPLTGKEAASRNFSEGLLRLALFPGCIWSVSCRKEMRRVLEYHGAEHEAICCLEKGLPLTTANVRAQSRLHPVVRCKFSHDGHAARTVCLFFFRRAAFLRARAAPARIAPCHCGAGL